MSTIPVILITVAGPAGHVDVGVRSDVTSAELAASLGDVLGTSPPWAGGEHRAPPRPGDPGGRRAQLAPGSSLAAAGVADGDLLIFGNPGDYPAPASADRRAGAEGRLPGPGAQLGPGSHDARPRAGGWPGAGHEGGRAR